MKLHAPIWIAILALNLAWSQLDAAEWIIAERQVPPPKAASDELRNSIAATPPPDAASRPAPPQSAEEWKAFVAPINEQLALANASKAEKLAVSLTPDEIATVPVIRLKPQAISPRNARRLFLNVHGGAYVFGSGMAGIGEAILIASRLEVPVVSIDYRMPPEFPFPAAVDDVIAVYQALLADYAPGRIIIGGTSAGGGLALASVLRCKELNLPVPGAVYAGTAWADLGKTGDTMYTNEGLDRSLVKYEGVLEQAALLYAGIQPLTNPLISPVYGDFSGFSPTILVTGTRDLFLSDNVRTHRKLRDANIEADLIVFEGMSHGEYTNLPDTPESAAVYRELAQFLEKHLD